MSEAPQFWDITIGNVSVLVGILIQGYVIVARANRQHGENQEKIKTLVTWKEAHDLDARQRDIAIHHLETLASAMKATADAMAKSVDLMQRQLEELLRRDRSGRKHDSDGD